MRTACAVLLLCGCSGSTNDPALDALLRVADAQFFRGPMPVAQDGPALQGLFLTNNNFLVGQRSKAISGVALPETRGVALALDGDPGYWMIPTGLPDPTLNNNLSWAARLSFSPLVPKGSYVLEARGVDAQGRFGPPSPSTLTTLDTTPSGTLVISLVWDTQADLDLHLITPAGVEVWHKHPNSLDPPGVGEPPNPDFWKAGGQLDFDSNAQCNIDGRRQEDVVWQATPPSGHYVVRVDTPLLCGEYQATWSVQAFLDGNRIGYAFGSSHGPSTWGEHGLGAGVTALRLDVP